MGFFSLLLFIHFHLSSFLSLFSFVEDGQGHEMLWIKSWVNSVLRQFLPNGLLFLSVLPQSYYVSIHLSFLVIIGLVHRRLVVDLYEEYNYIGAAVKGFWKQL